MEEKSCETNDQKVIVVESANEQDVNSSAVVENVPTEKLVGMPLAPSPTMTRELSSCRQMMVNTFHLIPKPEYDKDSYRLYNSIITEKATQMYNLARDNFDKQQYETCLSHLHKALIMKPNDIKYYVLRGDAYLQLCDFKSAILNFKHVCILDPENEEYFTKLASIYYLQGQCYFDEELYLDALECFARAAEMRPDNSGYHARSIACLAALKRHRECLDMINNRLEVDKDNPDLFIMRARIHLLFNNPMLSYFDVQRVFDLDPSNSEADFMQIHLEANAETLKEKAIKLNMGGETKEAIKKISHAIDTNPSVAEYHVLRAAMHRQNADYNAAVDDLLYVMDKSDRESDVDLFTKAQKQLLLTFNDFAVDCFNKGFYDEAILLLERAIKGEKEDPILYTNRGDCFYKVNHIHFALLDYQQAEELAANDPSVELRLSVVYNDLGIIEYKNRKYPSAEEYFTLALSHNPTVSSYYLSRARSRYMQEKIIEAQVDIISALHLDPSNKEMFALFTRLYPGKLIDEVLKGEYGQIVIEALQDVVAEKNLPSNCPEHPTKEKKVPLPAIKKESLAMRSEDLKQCMKDHEFQYHLIKGKKMVNELVESVIQCRQDLSYHGPRVASGPKKHLAKNTGSDSKLNTRRPEKRFP